MPSNPTRSGPTSTFPETLLVTSQKDLMVVAIQGQAKSWASNLARRIRLSLMRDGMLGGKDVDNLRHQLLWINSMRAWLVPYRQQVEMLQAANPLKKPSKAGEEEAGGMLKALSPQASRIMRKLVRRYIQLHRLPDPSNLPLQVNQLSGTVSKASRTRHGYFQRWLNISTLERGKRISLPIMGNAYADSVRGDPAMTYSLVEKDGLWEVLETKFIHPKAVDYKIDTLAIDLGLRNLMATSEGDLRGIDFIDELKRRDAQLLKIQKGLQQAGQLRLSQCKRYRLFVDRMRGWLKTTIQTHLNQLLELHRPRKVVIEDLLFARSKGELSKRMNRLLRRFGQRYFVQTLDLKQAELGFELIKIDAAYTSQECWSCGFIHRTNRNSNRFKCISCGHTGHSDVNAAKVQSRRSRSGAKTKTYVTRQARWAQALDQWRGSKESSILQATPGSPGYFRAVGSARAGLDVLVSHKSSAAKLDAKAKNELLNASQSTNLQGLLTGLRVKLVQEKRTTNSTRKSG